METTAGPSSTMNRSDRYGSDTRTRASSREYAQPNEYPPAAIPSIAPPTRSFGQTAGAQSDGSYERNLVAGLCAPGGMRAVPPKDKLDAFIKSALTLDAEIVGPILEDCLADEQWTVRIWLLSTSEMSLIDLS